ncbi:dolichyl-phosphate beta-glucosyltransferase [Nowakowskiella sp. JEL0407]|nr:dolichyl-phosphate beta-glucosyltransferase [Nowakowskiella sp. JEL0407]
MIGYVVGFIFACIILLGLILWKIAPNPREPNESEKYYFDVHTTEKLPFPSLIEESDPQGQFTPTLTVVIPAYNEAERIPEMLKETLEYLNDRITEDSGFSYEIIVVDDGSTDDTVKIARKCAKRLTDSSGKKEFRILKLTTNRGKGGAVTQGIMVSRGSKVLFADADGATKFSDVKKLELAIDDKEDGGICVAVGSRAHMVKSEAVVKRSFIRNFVMHGFHTILYILGIGSIRDTQCGFKLLSRNAAQQIIPNMHVEGWIFDIELLLIAQMLKIPIVEVPVSWHEVGGSKISLLKDSIRMLLDLLVIRLNYAFGIWVARVPQGLYSKKDK